MKLSRYEQETFVNYNAGEQTATVYTRDKTVMQKLDTLVAVFPGTYKLIQQNEISKTYLSAMSHKAVSDTVNDHRMIMDFLA